MTLRQPEGRLLLFYLGRSTTRGEYRLAGGGTSDVYVDVRRVCCEIPGRHLVGSLLWDRTSDCRPSVVGGVGFGGLLAAQALAYHARIASCVVRDKPKAHGRTKWIEGSLVEGDRVLMVEDVVTTGGSVLAACEHVQMAGGTVAAVAAVLDRGGGQAVRDAGFDFHALFTLADIPSGLPESYPLGQIIDECTEP